MRIAFLTSGRCVPSSRFRVLQFVPHLQRLGHECLVLPSRPDKYSSLPLLGFRWSGLVKRWNRRSDLVALERWSPDVVVLERELFSDGSYDIEQDLRGMTRRLVLDIDDGLFVLDRHKFEVLCGLSDHVIAGNDLLATRVQPINSRVTVIPTCVDVEKYQGRAIPRSSCSRSQLPSLKSSRSRTTTSGDQRSNAARSLRRFLRLMRPLHRKPSSGSERYLSGRLGRTRHSWPSRCRYGTNCNTRKRLLGTNRPEVRKATRICEVTPRAGWKDFAECSTESSPANHF